MLAPGCFWMPEDDRAASPLCEPSPRLSAAPTPDLGPGPAPASAGRPASATTVSPDLVRARCSRPMPWIRYSWPPATRKPAEVLRWLAPSALSTSSSVTLYASSRPAIERAPGTASGRRRWRSPARRRARRAGAGEDRVGRRAQVEQASAASDSSADEQDLAHDRRDRREHRRLDTGRQRAGDQAQLLGRPSGGRGRCPRPSRTPPTRSATPTAVAERTRRTPAAPLSAASIGNVTSDSISVRRHPARLRRGSSPSARSGPAARRAACARQCQPPHASRTRPASGRSRGCGATSESGHQSWPVL